MKKKFRLMRGCEKNVHLRKFWMTMKLTTFLFFLAITQIVASEAYSQTTKMTLQLKDVKVKQVLDRIEEKSEFFFLYNSKLVDVSRKVSVDAKDERIDEILNNLFQETGVVYTVVDRQIVLTNKADQAGFMQQNGQQQGKKVTGKVTDSNDGSLPGVSVIVKGTTTGVITDNNGNFSLANVPENAVLQFSFVGMKTQEIAVGSKTTINVTLTEEAIGLDEVVAIGYGTQKKRDVSGSISSVKGEDLARSGFSNAAQSLQGKTSGVFVVSGSGKPGSGVSVRIRGVGGVNDSEPLYIIDGIQGADISTVNSNDIESIEVLKDASSAAIYGSRGANGVVLVSTKKGKKDGMNVDYSGSVGFQNILNVGNVKFLNAKQFAQNFNAGFTNDGLPAPFGGTNTAAYPREFFPDPSEIGKGTNWWDVMTKNNTSVQDHQVSVSGGNEKQQLFTSIGYYNQEGNFINTGFRRYTFRINSEHKVTPWLTLGNNTSIARSKSTGSGFSNTYSDIWYSLTYNPLINVYNPDGTNAGPPHPQYGRDRNPYAVSQNTDLSSISNRIDNNFYASVKFLKYFTFKSNIAATLAGWNSNNFYNGIFHEGIAAGTNTQIYYSQGESQSYQWSNLLNFSHSIGKHNISALAGYELSEYSSKNATGRGQYTDPIIEVISTGQAKNSDFENNRFDGSMLSYFGNFTYNYAERYYLTGNIRRDGSSKFGANYRFGVFPSISGAWRVSAEEFFPKTFVSDFKIRASYGEVGNDKIGLFSYIAPLASVKYPMSGTNGAYDVGYVYSTMANPDLRWEKSIQKNIGVDLAFFRNKLLITADYFVTNVEDMLLGINIPTATGISDINSYDDFVYAKIITNVGKLANKGLEFDVKYNGRYNDFRYTLGANITTYNNKVTEIGDNDYLSGKYSRTYAGGSLGDFYGYVIDGIFQTQSEIDAANAINGKPGTYYQFAGTKPGDFKYRDLNKDGKINDSDRQKIGSPIPDFTYGINVDMDYKNLSLNVLFSGVQGNEIYNNMRSQMEYAGTQLLNNSTRVLNAWNGPGTSNTIARRTSQNANNYGGAKSIYVEDGSYFRLRTVQLAYNLSDNIAKKMLMKKARIYIAGDNLFTITKYLGFDPEVDNTSNLNAGVDDGFYPHSSIVRFGINVTF